uniref:Metallo-beta-lactamase superfamily protein n=1 Tax=uncultured microorganism TaxID=358574 RepID=F8UHT7_9ZZZZ|nr:metallo-beta-lactamase superfamily protein [uncultured microorganism]
MRIKVLFDKRALIEKFHTGWGVSFLIDDKILFDTGEKGDWLLENMRSLGVNIDKIEAVVISHDHWDHWGGLWDILKERKGLKVYSCPGFSKEFKDKVKEAQAELVENERVTEIMPDIYITGEIPGAYHGKYMAEQAMVLKTKNGLTIITGCAHPGILKMIEKAKTKFPAEPIYLVLGGFHLMESDRRAIEIVAENFKTMGITKAAPTHCSGEIAEDIFKKYYTENFVSIKVGQEMEV